MVEGKQHAALRKYITRRHNLIARVIQRIAGVEIRGQPGTYPGDPDTTHILPKVSQADGVAVFIGPDGRPQTAVVIEIQRSENPEKAAVWPIYLWTTALELNCEVHILVVATSRRVGRWARNLGGGKYAKLPGAQLIVVDADNVPIPSENGDVDDSILAAWVRAAEPDWAQAAATAIRMLRDQEDYDTFVSGIENQQQLKEIKKMAKTAEKPWFDVIVAEEAAKAAAKAAAEAAELAEAKAMARALRDKADTLLRLVESHPDIAPVAAEASKEAQQAEAKLAKLLLSDKA